MAKRRTTPPVQRWLAQLSLDLRWAREDAASGNCTLARDGFRAARATVDRMRYFGDDAHKRAAKKYDDAIRRARATLDVAGCTRFDGAR